MSEFFEMGGYAAYVWSAYGFAALVLIGLVGHSVGQARRREREFLKLREVARSDPKPEVAKRRTAARARPVATVREAAER